MIRAIMFVLLVASLSVPSASASYPRGFQQVFVGSCMAGGGAQRRCVCGSHWIQRHFTYAQYRSYQRRGILRPVLIGASLACQ